MQSLQREAVNEFNMRFVHYLTSIWTGSITKKNRNTRLLTRTCIFIFVVQV